VPRIAVLTGVVNQDVWSLRNLDSLPIQSRRLQSHGTDRSAGRLRRDLQHRQLPTRVECDRPSKAASILRRGRRYIGALLNALTSLLLPGSSPALTAANRSATDAAASWAGTTRAVRTARSSGVPGAGHSDMTANLVHVHPCNDGRRRPVATAGYFWRGCGSLMPNPPRRLDRPSSHTGPASRYGAVDDLRMNPLYRADPSVSGPCSLRPLIG